MEGKRLDELTDRSCPDPVRATHPFRQQVTGRGKIGPSGYKGQPQTHPCTRLLKKQKNQGNNGQQVRLRQTTGEKGGG